MLFHILCLFTINHIILYSTPNAVSSFWLFPASLPYYSSSVYNVYILSGFNWKIGLWAQWWLPGDCDGPVCPASPLWCVVYQRGHLCKFFKASLLKDVHSKYTFTDLHAWGHTQSFLFQSLKLTGSWHRWICPDWNLWN